MSGAYTGYDVRSGKGQLTFIVWDTITTSVFGNLYTVNLIV